MATLTSENLDRRKSSKLEQHIQTIMIAVVTGAIMWMGSYFFTDKAEKAVLANEVSTISRQLSSLQAELKEVKTELQFLRSGFVTRDQFQDHEERLRLLEALRTRR